MQRLYHQQTKNLLVSYLPEEAGLLLGTQEGHLTSADSRQVPLRALA